MSLNFRKKKSIYLLETVCSRKHENGLPEKAVQSFALEILKNTLDTDVSE